MEENDEICLGLGLGLGLHEYTPKRDNLHKSNKRVFFLDLSIPNSHPNDHGISPSSSILKINIGEDEKQGSKEEDCTIFSKDCSRKKLRLTRDQSTLLEDSFKLHSTLNTAQKQALAEKLNLKPRQVEVWFQNRRARTKLKQTEVDCQFLKKNCERLSEENLRLKKELLELRSSVKTEKTTPFFYQISKACPSCEKIDESCSNNNNRGGSGETAAVTEVVRQPININPNDHQKTASLGSVGLICTL